MDAVIARAAAASIPIARLGTTGSATVAIASERPMVVAALIEHFERWLPAYMAGAA